MGIGVIHNDCSDKIIYNIYNYVLDLLLIINIENNIYVNF